MVLKTDLGSTIDNYECLHQNTKYLAEVDALAHITFEKKPSELVSSSETTSI